MNRENVQSEVNDWFNERPQRPVTDFIMDLLVKYSGPIISDPVLKEWAWGLPWMQQTVLLCALRGADGLPKRDVSKTVHYGLRAVLLNNAKPESGFMMLGAQPLEIGVNPLLQAMARMLDDHDRYAQHYLIHLAHAAEIIGYKHTDQQTAATWLHFYESICEAMHMKPETEEELDRRLTFGPCEAHRLTEASQ